MLKNMLRKNNLFFTLQYTFYMASYTTFYGYFVNYLREALGFGDFAASLAPTCTMMAMMLGQPVLGYIADTYIPMKPMVFGLLGASIPLTLFVMQLKGSWVLVALFILSMMDVSGMSLFDAWIFRLGATTDPTIEFGMIRAVCNLGSGLLALVGGQMLAQYGYPFMFWLHAVLLAITLAFAAFVDGVSCANRGGQPQQGQKQEGGIPYGKALGMLIRNRPYVIIVCSVMLAQFANRASVSFLARIVLEAGGTSGHTGIANFINSLFSFLTMTSVTWMLRKGARRELLVAGGLLFAVVRYGLVASHFTLWTFIITCALSSISGGCWSRIFPDFISMVTPGELTSTAITTGTALATGIGGMVGSLVGGWMMEAYGVGSYLWFVTGISVLAFAVSLLNVRRRAPQEAACAGQQEGA